MGASAGYWWELVTGERRGLTAALLRAPLIAASVPYALLVWVRNKLYDWGVFRVHRAAVPVVVVGNLTVGGTGKTPAVEWVARFYRDRGRQVAILSRGYGVSDGRNDEALVLEANLNDVPHLQGADRVALARTAGEELESDLLVLDDGFQHRRLHRDLDLVLVDATQPLRWCLPGGLLREPRSGLRRAHAVIITRSDQAAPGDLDRLRRVAARYLPGQPVVEARHAPVALHNTQDEQPVSSLRGRAVAAVCGIGNPAGFLATLRELGANVVDEMIYPDHHAYRREDVAAIEARARRLPADAWVVTTQKDWVKLRIDRLGDRPLWSLRIALDVTRGREALEATLLGILKQPVGGTPTDDSSSFADPSSGGDSSVRKDAYDPSPACPV
jgi:tetraacyldisaccharide 4'-kinase